MTTMYKRWHIFLRNLINNNFRYSNNSFSSHTLKQWLSKSKVYKEVKNVSFIIMGSGHGHNYLSSASMLEVNNLWITIMCAFS
jgi:hypothetical protein